MKKKILFVINTLGHAGAEVALMELLRNLSPEQYEVSLLVLLGQGDMVKELPAHVRLLNKHYDACPILTEQGKQHLKRHVLRAMLSRGAVIRELPYLVKHFLKMKKQGKILTDKLLWRVAAVGAPRIREHFDLAVAYLEGGSAYYVADYIDADRKAAFIHIDYNLAGYNRELDQDCYLKYDRIFGVSGEVKEHFLSVYPECADRTDTFQNLINQEAIRKKAKKKGGFTDGYAGKRILTVGRLNPQKAYEVSIDAMKLIKDAGVKARWYVLGEGDEREKLEAQIRRLGLEEDFLLPGATDNPYPYFAQTDLYVHCTRYEGKSIAIQEAQTLGCPILVSNCSGNREQVVDGEDGLMCELTPESIRDGVLELLQDDEKRKRLGDAAAQKQIMNRSEINKLLSLISD